MPNRRLLFLALWLLSLPSFCLGQTPQIISFPKPDDVNMGAAPFAVNATTTAPGLTVTLTSTSQTFCTLAGTTVTLVAVGKCSITATQAGGVSGGVTYSAAAPVSQSFQVNSQFPGVDAVFGIGSLITGNRTNYKVNSTANVLEGTQMGEHLHSSLLACLSNFRLRRLTIGTVTVLINGVITAARGMRS
jgi:hypothetical protein